MQLGAVNSLNFRANYQENPAHSIDIARAENFVEAVRDWEDSVDFSNKETGEKKSVGAIVGSVVTCAGGAFLIARGMTKKGASALEAIKNNEKVKNFISDEKVKQNLGRLTGVLSGAKNAIAKKLPDGLKTKVSNIATTVSDVVKNKVGVANSAGIAAAAVATPYFATRDNNEDGIADMMQKGVSAYEGVMDKVGKLKVVADLLV